ncbi:MAG TPA: hypothetical protein VFV93_09505, partial [Thermomicrobiales bacterium]|nr:hypothetical protein [Thermomicrobiales bacterium]
RHAYRQRSWIMWEPETLEMQELGENEGFDFEGSGENDFFGDFEGASWESGSDLFSDYESVSGASLEDLEGDPFLGDLVRGATQTLNRVTGGIVNDQFLKNLAKQAATVAGGAIAGQQGARIAGQLANQVIREGDFESMYENGSYEGDLMSAGVDMEALADLHYYANQMAEAQSEAEADQFLGALLPVIGQVAAPLISNLLGGRRESGDFFDEEDWSGESRDEFLPALIPLAAPLIAKGVGAIGKMLSKGPKTRKFAAAAPKIATAAATKVARQAASGRPPTPQRIAATVGSEAARVLSSPTQLKKTVQQNRAIARRVSSGVPAASAVATRPNGNGARPVPRPHGRAPYGAYGASGATRGRPRVIGYLPVYAKR